MDFTHQLNHYGDTIVARATPMGAGGVAIIRLSGEKSAAIASQITGKDLEKAENRKAYFTRFKSPDGTFIDEGLTLMMRAPNSYTGEDVVELQCHGGMFIVKAIIDAAVHHGARLAQAGEFTKRAFLNGKMDLTKAESVCDMIAAKSAASHKAASAHLKGKLEMVIQKLMDDLIDMAAHFEVAVDYPEEELEISAKQTMIELIQAKLKTIDTLLSTFNSGQKAKTGTSISLIGSPNVGKSSLMNALLGQARCIVTDVAGTTRDFIEEDFFISGVHFHLKDTAGIRKTDSHIEKAGIEASLESIKEADITLFVLDASQPIPTAIAEKLDPKKTIALWNKVDLKKPETALNFPHTLAVSAKTGFGLNKLKDKLVSLASMDEKESKEAVLITSDRHKNLLEMAREDLMRVEKGLGSDLSFELLAFDMKSGLSHLSSIIGRNINEDILSSIFDNFCVGK